MIDADAPSQNVLKTPCSVCSRRIKATDAALWLQTADGQREHTHIACMRPKAVELQEQAAT
jgi:hypothetical protein